MQVTLTVDAWADNFEFELWVLLFLITSSSDISSICNRRLIVFGTVYLSTLLELTPSRFISCIEGSYALLAR